LLQSLRFQRSDLHGYQPVLLPHASLLAIALPASANHLICRATAIVFPSPFAISAAFNHVIAVRIALGLPLPVVAVIGQGSLQILGQEIAALGLNPLKFKTVTNLVEPFDAEHLAPLLRVAVLKEAKANATEFTDVPERESEVLAEVLIVTGDRTNNDAQAWSTWLNDATDSTASPIKVCQMQAYENQDTTNYAELISSSIASEWCHPKSVAYFTSSSSVRVFAQAAKPALQHCESRPLAISIHPKISKEIDHHLGWKVVEILPGPAALLNWMSEHVSPSS
jgi:uroporphyrinogen-III synthase